MLGWDLNKIKICLLLLLWCVIQCLRLVTLDRCSRDEVLLVLARIMGTAVDLGRFYRAQVAGGALWRGLGRGMCRQWMYCCCVSDEEPRWRWALSRRGTPPRRLRGSRARDQSRSPANTKFLKKSLSKFSRGSNITNFKLKHGRCFNLNMLFWIAIFMVIHIQTIIHRRNASCVYKKTLFFVKYIFLCPVCFQINHTLNLN